MAKKINQAGKDFKKYLAKASKREIKQARVEVFNEVVKRTPVLTGKARQAWKISDEDIVNDCGYLEQLEEGHSGQAPQGFVKQSIKLVINRRKK